MVCDLVHDTLFLSLKSVSATKDDKEIAENLLDTLKHYKESCVGMAANMIGERKRIIAFVLEDGSYMVMFNPEIIKKSEPYVAMEGCLSLLGGEREAKRWGSIKVSFENESFQKRTKTFKGRTAQIIQHELDHCEGVLI